VSTTRITTDQNRGHRTVHVVCAAEPHDSSLRCGGDRVYGSAPLGGLAPGDHFYAFSVTQLQDDLCYGDARTVFVSYDDLTVVADDINRWLFEHRPT
jgi:hypothetical protein